MLANLAKRPLADPWALETTTAPEPGMGSVAESTMLYAQRIAEEGTGRNALFFFHRQAVDKHELDTENGLRAAIVEASGPFIAKWTAVGHASPSSSATRCRPRVSRAVWLNRPVQASGMAFDVEQWRLSRGRPSWCPTARRSRSASTVHATTTRRRSLRRMSSLVSSGRSGLDARRHAEWEVPVTEVDGACRRCLRALPWSACTATRRNGKAGCRRGLVGTAKTASRSGGRTDASRWRMRFAHSSRREGR
jgi:hypothetical protein